MADAQLSFRKSANIDRVTDKRKDSLFRLVDTDGSGTIDAQEFAVLYDAIKKDLAEELEKEAALQKEASSARRRFKMLLLFVAVLVSFLAASVAANFAVIFTVVDQAITTTTTTTGLLEVKGSDAIAKTAAATEDVPLIVAPALDLETLSQVKSLKVTYRDSMDLSAKYNDVEASMTVVAVRKHNATFVEFITDVAGETIEALNGVASFVRYPTTANGLEEPIKHQICSANATCSAFRTSGIDVDAATDIATDALITAGFLPPDSRRLQVTYACSEPGWTFIDVCGWSWQTNADEGACPGTDISRVNIQYYSTWSNYRDIVFFAHGKGQDADGIWPMICVPPNGESHVNFWDCPMLTRNVFKPLLFVWLSSTITDAGSTVHGGAVGWSVKIEESTYGTAAANLATIFCGSGGSFDSCNFNAGMFGAYVGTPKIMVVGFSDGGGLGMYLNYFYYSVFSHVVAMDFWAYGSYDTWLLQGYDPTEKPMLKAKIYTHCDSPIFTGGPALALFQEAPSFTWRRELEEETESQRRQMPELFAALEVSRLPLMPPAGLDGPMTYGKAALGIWAQTSSSYNTECFGVPENCADNPIQYMEYKWKLDYCGAYVQYAVHGLPNGFSPPFGGSPAWYSGGTCVPLGDWLDVHVSMGFASPVYTDIRAFQIEIHSKHFCNRKGDYSPILRFAKFGRQLAVEKVELEKSIAERAERRELRGKPVWKSAKADKEAIKSKFVATTKAMKGIVYDEAKGTVGLDSHLEAVMTKLGLTPPKKSVVPAYKRRSVKSFAASKGKLELP